MNESGPLDGKRLGGTWKPGVLPVDWIQLYMFMFSGRGRNNSSKENGGSGLRVQADGSLPPGTTLVGLDNDSPQEGGGVGEADGATVFGSDGSPPGTASGLNGGVDGPSGATGSECSLAMAFSSPAGREGASESFRGPDGSLAALLPNGAGVTVREPSPPRAGVAMREPPLAPGAGVVMREPSVVLVPEYPMRPGPAYE